MMIESNVIRGFRDAMQEYNEYACTGMINEVSPLETLGITVSVLASMRSKTKSK